MLSACWYFCSVGPTIDDIRFKLFNPSRFVREKLEHASSMSAFEIAGLDEMMALLSQADQPLCTSRSCDSA